MEKIKELKKIKNLLEEGVLTNEEFNILKKELLDSTSSNPIINNELVNKNQSLENIKENNEKKNILTLIKKKGHLVNDVYLIEDEELVKGYSFTKSIYGWSGWSGLLESLGTKNAKKKLAIKAKELKCNVVLITDFGDSWGVKISGNAYKIS